MSVLVIYTSAKINSKDIHKNITVNSRRKLKVKRGGVSWICGYVKCFVYVVLCFEVELREKQLCSFLKNTK